jgi:hypothetical protein
MLLALARLGRLLMTNRRLVSFSFFHLFFHWDFHLGSTFRCHGNDHRVGLGLNGAKMFWNMIAIGKDALRGRF